MKTLNFHLANTRALTRRHFFARTGLSLGGIALGSLVARDGLAASATVSPPAAGPLAAKPPTFPARAKAVIYMHMAGAPPSLDLFDYKPKLNELNMQPCPESLFKGQRFAFIKGVPKMLGSPHKFHQHGTSGAWVSELLPHMSGIVDDACIVKSLWTDQFNHAPAELFLFTGLQRPGNASLGSWVTYGLGSESQDLPGFIVLSSGGSDPSGGKNLWSSGFLPSVYQGVQCRTTGEPILYANDPPGMDRASRRRSLDTLRKLNEAEAKLYGDPETVTRIEQYELAYRMQISVPEVFDISKEPQSIREMYGAKPGEGGFANNCLLARRLVEKGVRFVQLFDWGWDMHGTSKENDLVTGLPKKCQDVDRACAALITDLKQRGMLDGTLVIWGGEFGRTPMNEARNGSTFLGRDHHPNCFTMLLAGGGIKPGLVFGETDEFGYNVVRDKVNVRDLQQTILHQLGLDAHKFGFPYLGLNQRLIGPTEEAQLVKEILS
ncbi:MAG TPA: DUF1501 domain-containing protein [Verrucomicrobiae bacterium]|nr:DUF1501 domain-containing protein [Verrucomicrobiae bacterium]